MKKSLYGLLMLIISANCFAVGLDSSNTPPTCPAEFPAFTFNSFRVVTGSHYYGVAGNMLSSSSWNTVYVKAHDDNAAKTKASRIASSGLTAYNKTAIEYGRTSELTGYYCAYNSANYNLANIPPQQAAAEHVEAAYVLILKKTK